MLGLLDTTEGRLRLGDGNPAVEGPKRAELLLFLRDSCFKGLGFLGLGHVFAVRVQGFWIFGLRV